MKAAVCHAFGEPLRVEDVELRGPGLGEVSVQVAACAICHSDVAFMQGAWGGELPAVYGHEAAGVPADVPLEAASLLACGVITGVGAVWHTAGVEPGSSVVVFGAGGVGLNVVQGAALAGAGMIVAVDLADSKVEAARLFGATHTLNAARDDVVAEVRSVTRGAGADYAFDASGAVPAIEQGAQLIRRGGTLVLVGLPPAGTRVTFDGEAIADGALRILGSKVGSVRPQIDIPELVGLYRE